MGRTEGVTKELLDKRFNYVIKLKLKGYSQLQILTEANTKASTENWGTIGTRQLKRIFADFHKTNTLEVYEERETMKGLRELHLLDMENVIGELHEEIQGKKEWQPYEKEKALKTLFDMKAKYAALRGWDYSIMRKREEEILNEEDKISMNQMYDEASRDIIHTKPEAVSVLIDQVTVLRDKLKVERENKPRSLSNIIIFDTETGERMSAEEAERREAEEKATKQP